MSLIKFLLYSLIATLITSNILSDTVDTYSLEFFLDRNEFTQGEEIILNIKFQQFNDFQKTLLYNELEMLFGITLTDSNGLEYRNLWYFVSRSGFIDMAFRNKDSIKSNEIKLIKTNLNCQYTTNEAYYTYNVNCLVNLPVGYYTINFVDHFLQDKNSGKIIGTPLHFRILPNN